MLNNKIFNQGMIRLSSFFKKDDISDLFLEDYYKAIQELTDEQFIRAIEYLIKNHQSHFFPVPAQLVKAVEETRRQLELTPLEMRIGQDYVPCPDDVKQKMKEVMAKVKRRTV